MQHAPAAEQSSCEGSFHMAVYNGPDQDLARLKRLMYDDLQQNDGKRPRNVSCALGSLRISGTYPMNSLEDQAHLVVLILASIFEEYGPHVGVDGTISFLGHGVCVSKAEGQAGVSCRVVGNQQPTIKAAYIVNDGASLALEGYCLIGAKIFGIRDGRCEYMKAEDTGLQLSARRADSDHGRSLQHVSF